jgi:hypothetical protein
MLLCFAVKSLVYQFLYLFPTMRLLSDLRGLLRLFVSALRLSFVVLLVVGDPEGPA